MNMVNMNIEKRQKDTIDLDVKEMEEPIIQCFQELLKDFSMSHKELIWNTLALNP